MWRIALALSLVAVPAAVAVASARPTQAIWCSPPKPYVPGSWPRSEQQARDRDDVEIHLVARSALRGAMRRLSEREIVPLSVRRFRRLVKDGERPTPGRYLYLVRAGVMTPEGLSGADFLEYAESASYGAAEPASPSSPPLNIVSLITSHREQRPRNYALLIASPAPVTDIEVHCIGGR